MLVTVFKNHISSFTDYGNSDKPNTPRHNVLLLCLIAVAVLGIALIAMGEDIGTDMSFRTFGHLVSHLTHSDYYFTTCHIHVQLK